MREKAVVPEDTLARLKLEREKYVRVYRDFPDRYGMRGQRAEECHDALRYTVKHERDSGTDVASYLDVGCGFGELLEFARDTLRIPLTFGTEIVGDLVVPQRGIVNASAFDLPFKSATIVSLIDVIEHIPAGDDELAIRECWRVAERALIVSANNNTSNKLGDELHINRRPYEEWHRLFCEWTPGRVSLERRDGHSPIWILRK